MAELLSRGPLKVTVNGLDARAQTRLAMFLQAQARGVCELVGEEQAEAAIVDLDGFGGERLWQSLRERFQGPAVVMSVGEKQLPNALWVRKPINADDFLAAIESINRRLLTERHPRELEPAAVETRPAARPEPAVAEPTPAGRIATGDRRPAAPRSAEAVAASTAGETDGVGRAASLAWNEERVHESCGAMEDSVYLDPKRRRELYYDPAEHLQEVLQRACRRAADASRAVRLELGGQAMIVLAGGRQVFSDVRPQRLRPLSVMPAAGRSAVLTDLREGEVPPMSPADPGLLPCESMLWMVSLWASRGRVPRGTDLDAPVSLANWPGFSRLLIPPHGMQIAALWTSRPQSLMQTGKALGIPYRYVFAMYSACVALGLVEQAPAAKAAVTPGSDTLSAPAGKRSFLGGLLRKLRLAD